MSRRSKTTSTSLGQNASHPQEHYPVYRAFLMRSLDRCDSELAAMVELNRSLHTAKESIVETCGEATLLDIGQGLVKLGANDELEGSKIPEQGQELCVDFLLRMKLRRKILNRLSRRLGRLAHAMDGEDVQPPPPPKYGDLRLHIDPKAVEAFEERFRRQEQAMKILDMRHETYIPPKEEEEETQETKPAAAQGENTTDEQGTSAKANEAKSSDNVDKVVEEQESKGNEHGAGEATEAQESKEDEDGKAKTMEHKGTEDVTDEAKNVEESAPGDAGKPTEKPEEEKSSDQPEEKTEGSAYAAKPEEDVVMSENRSDAEEGPKTSEASKEDGREAEAVKSDEKAEGTAETQGEQQQAESESKPDGVTSVTGEKTTEETKSATDEQPAEQADDAVDSDLLTEEDYIDALKDYDEAYTKEIFASSGTVKYPILTRGDEADHHHIKYGGGIGAAHRTMSAKDREMEFKRWQTAVLQRIPDQPSFQELGLANRVFFLEERRKRVAEEAAMSPSKRKKAKKEEAVDDSDSDKDLDDDVEMKEADEDDEDYEAEKAKDEDVDDSEMDDKDDDDDTKSKTKEEGKADFAPVKPVKPISLVAVPSFHEQDTKRVRMIHAELMATSMHDHARLRIGEATNEYNEAFRRSNDLYNHRMKVQADLAHVSQETRMHLSQLKHEFFQEVAAKRSRWEVRHREHALASLPSAQGIAAKGTPRSAAAANHPNQIVSGVGKALSDIVDSVVARTESGGNNQNPIEPFQPPPMPDFMQTVLPSGEKLGERQERLEGHMRVKLTDLGSKLHASEEERKKAWKKLLKVKGDFDMPHHHVTHTGGSRGRVSYGPNQFSLLPVPPLRASGAAAMPTSYSYPMASVPSYVPPAAAMLPMPTSRPVSASESKYSAARLRERHSTDGSVAPASEPKRGPDGLYIRPPGRGRIGMDWDEVRGLWVPLKK